MYDDRPEPKRPVEAPRTLSAAHFGWLLALSYIGVSDARLPRLPEHIRCAAAHAHSRTRWFYGDSVFIIDPWLWLLLGLGARSCASIRRRWIARLRLALATIYIGAMLVSARARTDHRRGSLDRDLRLASA